MKWHNLHHCDFDTTFGFCRFNVGTLMEYPGHRVVDNLSAFGDLQAWGGGRRPGHDASSAGPNGGDRRGGWACHGRAGGGRLQGGQKCSRSQARPRALALLGRRVRSGVRPPLCPLASPHTLRFPFAVARELLSRSPQITGLLVAPALVSGSAARTAPPIKLRRRGRRCCALTRQCAAI